MSSSSYITIYPSERYEDSNFQSSFQKAEKVFNYIWKKKYSGFNKDGSIKWPEADEFFPFKHIKKQENNYWFGFFNGCYPDSYLDDKEKLHVAFIYELFGEIFSSLNSDYIVCVSVSEGFRPSLIFMEGKRYESKGDIELEEYYQALLEKEKSEDQIDKAKETLEKVKGVIQERESLIQKVEKKGVP